MKVSLEIKDAPKYQRVEVVTTETHKHSKVQLTALVTAVKKGRPWAKIIDIRVDLR